MGEREIGNIPARVVRALRHRSHVFLSQCLLASLVLFLCAPGARADVLGQLIANPAQSITSGDKQFSNFTATATHSGPTFTADVNQIEVSSFSVANPQHPLQFDFGLRFHSTGTGPMVSAGANSFADILIGFDVLVTDERYFAKDLGLTFQASAPADGNAQVVETATFTPPGGSAQALGQTFVSVPSPNQTSSHIDLFPPGPYRLLHIVKDVAVIGGAAGTASIIEITQTFSQTPEPGTLLLLGIGSAFLALRRRRGVARLIARTAVPAAALAFILGTNPARAAVLQTLVDTPGSFVTQGDKRFEHFAYVVDTNPANTFGKTVFDASAINVGTRSEGQDIVLSFEGLISALSTVTPNSKLKLTIDFDVVVDPQQPQRLHDLSLFFNGQPFGAGASAQVVETVTPVNPNSPPLPSPTLTVSTAQIPGSLTAHLDLPANYQAVHVSKVITLNGGPESLASITVIEQRFSQVVPEPVAITAWLLGLPLLARRRRLC